MIIKFPDMPEIEVDKFKGAVLIFIYADNHTKLDFGLFMEFPDKDNLRKISSGWIDFEAFKGEDKIKSIKTVSECMARHYLEERT